MDASRWRRIDDIFHAAVGEPAGAARDAKLSQLCGDDRVLAAEVAALLAADDRLESAAPPADPHVGLRLGHYAIDGLIARGGMAAVYAAHRADDQFQQRVAVKIMDLRLSDPAVVAQFRAERQILAALEHPTLTRLLDGGVTAFGEPYLVMEYVEGARLDEYCDRQRLDLPGRIALFTEVCAGVAFAHRNLVLHRDLKPSNILVTAAGHAKVVDFGTATLLQPERLATISRAPLTPAYASPEQLTGQAVGTASDQYSLGLVLYELLAGVPAFADRASLMGSIERALAGAQPAPAHLAVTAAAAAARRTSPARLRRQLSGDLGTILRKTLAADPAARYSSVQHVADDLERWAAGEAILGRAPSLVYRTSRFARRHWLPVSLAATLLVSLLTATAVSLQQTAIARQQAAIAVTESAKARQLNRFLTGMLSSANPMWVNPNAANAGSITVRQILDGAGELIASELGAAPAVEAEMRRTLGRTYLGMGESDKAMPHLDRALALYREQGDAPGLARTQWHRGVVHINRGDFTGAEALIREAVDYVRSQDPPVDAEFQLGATADLGMAIGSQRPGDSEAVALMREAITIADRHGLRGGALVLANLSIQLIRRGELDEGETALREALRRWETLKTTSPEYYSGLRTLAVLLFQRGDYVAAERTAARAVDGFGRMMSDHPMMPNFKLWWARTLLALGDLERGRPVARDAYAGYARIRPAGHPELATPLIALGIAHRLDGQLQESSRVIREARAILQRHPSGRDRAADAAGELGLTLRALGNAAEADLLLRESHSLYQAAYGDAHPLTAQALARVQGGERVRAAR